MKQQEYSKKIEDSILSKNWEFGYERRMTYQRIRGFNYSHYYHLPGIFKVSTKYEIFRIKDRNVSLYRESSEDIKAFGIIEEKLSNSNSRFLIDRITKIIETSYKEFDLFTRKLPTSYKSYSDTKLLRQYEKICRMDNKVSLPNRLTFTQFEAALTEAIRKNLPVDGDDPESVIESLSFPSVPIPLDIYKNGLFEILLSPISKRKMLLDRFARKYAHWGMFDFNYDSADRNYHEAKLNELDSNHTKDFRLEIKNKYLSQRKKTKSVLQKYAGKSHVFSLLKLYNTTANLKEWKNYYREQNSYKLRFFMEEVSRRFGYALSEISFMSYEEMASLLKGKLKINRSELAMRKENSAFVFVSGRLSVVTDEKKLCALDAKLNISSESEITGKVVFKGIIVGIAKIVVSDRDFHKVNEGDILVAGTTRPSYVPIMQKASAFITNEGGLLSHAAIIAREMKKPCIVGTKIATKILKDGDLIEVNADKGVVKILKREN